MYGRELFFDSWKFIMQKKVCFLPIKMNIATFWCFAAWEKNGAWG